MKNNALVRTAVKTVLKKVIDDPQKNMPKLLAFAEKHDKEHVNQRTYDNLHKALEDPKNNWNILLTRVFEETDPQVLLELMMSLGFHSAMASFTERMENVEKYGCNIPWAVLMDPTAACNLKCTGCWAAEYGKGSQLSYQLMDRIIKEGMELGTYTYIFSGGEPTMRKKDLAGGKSSGMCIFGFYKRHACG